MSFQAKFNSGKFNIYPTEGWYLRPVNARAVFWAKKPLLKSNLPLGLRQAAAASRAWLTFTVRAHLALKQAKPFFGTGLMLSIKRMLSLEPSDAVFRAGKNVFVKMYALDTVYLEGITLEPGDVLVIDTDRVTAEKNGVSVIEYWQTGSKPFRFVNGENIISYMDGGKSRNAGMQIIWRERYL